MNIKSLYCILIWLFIIGCHYKHQTTDENIGLVKLKENKSKKYYIYNHSQLQLFLDSVAQLNTQPLADKASYYIDSIFKNQPQINKLISTENYNKLKHAIVSGFIDIKTAKSVFTCKDAYSLCSNAFIAKHKRKSIPIVFYSFTNNEHLLDEYAICLGYPERCENVYLYFFKGNRIISKHYASNKYGLELKHYKDIDGKTIVYYKMQLVSGSGNWWQQYFFYKYEGSQLIPVLNELQNGNVANSIGNRSLWLESFVMKTNPLTIKMVYHDQLFDTTKDDFGPMLIQDSTLVQYIWNEKSKKMVGDYSQCKLIKAQILSYNLEDNDLLFINTHYKLLKKSLSDTAKRDLTYSYLNFVKNHIDK